MANGAATTSTQSRCDVATNDAQKSHGDPHFVRMPQVSVDRFTGGFGEPRAAIDGIHPRQDLCMRCPVFLFWFGCQTVYQGDDQDQSVYPSTRFKLGDQVWDIC